MLSAILSTRVVRFEVDAEREGRWTTESVAESESEAIEIARRLLGGKGCEAVRVMRALESRGSVVGTTEIFTERRPTGGADTRLASCDDEGAWCETLDDLYGNQIGRAHV